MFELFEVFRSPGEPGGDPSGGNPLPPPPAPSTTPTGGGEDEKKFTQKDMDREVVERGKRYAATAVQDLLKGIGLEKPEDLKAIIDEHKKLKESQMSELDAAKSEADRWKKKFTEAEAARVELESTLQVQKLRSAILDWTDEKQIGFASAKAREDALDVLSRTVSFDEEGKVKELDKAMEALQKERAYLFNAAPPPPPDLNSRNSGRSHVVNADELREQKRRSIGAAI